MKHFTFLTLACATFWLIGCSGGSEKRAAKDYQSTEKNETPVQIQAESDKRATKAKDEQNAVPPVASNLNLKQSNRDFIRTGEVRFQVKNVYKTTLEIEDLVAKYKGFITETTLKNEVARTEELEVSRDSVLRVMLYRVNNHITIRLPQDSLDMFMRDIGKWLVFLDHRIVKAEDVTLSLKAHDMRAKRATNYEQRYTKAIDNQGKELDKTAQAEDNLLQKQNEADQNLLNQQSLRDQVQYSTLTLNIYQTETIHRVMIENYRKIEQYQPNFWYKMSESFMIGWKGILGFVVGIFAIWPILIVFGIGLFIAFRNFVKK